MKQKSSTKGKIQTVLGPISPGKITGCLCHEHFVMAGPNTASIGTREYLLQNVVPQFQKLHGEHGCNTLVECTCNQGWGRDVETYAFIARKAGINIIASTGYFKATRNSWWMKDASAKTIAEHWIKEIREGIGDTGIRPGIIKASPAKSANEAELFPELNTPKLMKKWLKAVCLAHHETGLPITTHSNDDTLAADLKSFTSLGVPPEAVALGHADTATIESSLPVLDQGVYLIHNFCGGFEEPYFNRAMNRLKGLLDQGYANQLMLSVDWKLSPVWKPIPDNPGVHTLVEGDLIKRDPAERSYSHVYTHVIPALKKMGISEQDIIKMVRNNPRRHLAGLYS